MLTAAIVLTESDARPRSGLHASRAWLTRALTEVRLPPSRFALRWPGKPDPTYEKSRTKKGPPEGGPYVPEGPPEGGHYVDQWWIIGTLSSASLAIMSSADVAGFTLFSM